MEIRRSGPLVAAAALLGTLLIAAPTGVPVASAEEIVGPTEAPAVADPLPPDAPVLPGPEPTESSAPVQEPAEAVPTTQPSPPPVAAPWRLSLSAPPVRYPAPLTVIASIAVGDGPPLTTTTVLVRIGERVRRVPVTGPVQQVEFAARPGAYAFSASLVDAAGTLLASSGPVTTTVGKAAAALGLTAPATLRSEVSGSLVATLASKAPVAGRTIRLEAKLAGTTGWVRLSSGSTDTSGRAVFRVARWRGTFDYRVVQDGDSGLTASVSPTRTVRTVGHFAAVTPDWGKPVPKVAYPNNPPPIGAGANLRTESISAATLARMKGLSWRSGCPVGPNDLRRLTVNVYGFDGYRYRGEMIVHRRVAWATGEALKTLSAQRFPIRQMRLPDVYGLSPNGVGANDYKSMAADNTYGFNCRYVVGREAERVWSPHAYGRAIDINPYENPYAARTGIFPAKQWWPRATSHRAVFSTASDPEVRAFTSHGFTWGGTWRSKDYHHFQRRLR